ncbi:MAG: hypothetical protein LUQ37_09615 [Methanoregulaceae archaeon]|jgi:hypothetical protein|nr:hypothetical protein [Methanoregulaceae archaeon]
MSVPARVLNDMFSQRLDTSEGKEKIAQAGSVYIRDRLREVCFVDKLIPAEPVTRVDCQRSVNHDTLVKIVDVEPQSRAMTVTFRGQPTARFIRAPRAEVPFYTISSEKFEKTEQELLAYEMPITKIIEDNSVKDLQEIKDREFLRHIEAAVQAIQKEANGGTSTALHASTYDATVKKSIIKGQGCLTAGLDDFVVHPVLRPDLVNLFKLLDGNRLRSERFLMTEPDYDDILSWTLQDAGDKMQSETMVDGYKYNILLGRKLIRTIKTDILRTGNVYCFTAPEFLGKNYILNNTKFYIDKVANMITWQSWMDVAIAVINIASVTKLELYGGSVTPGATDGSITTGYGTKLPVDEDQLGAVNNRVDQGLKFPDVSQF